MLRSVKKLFEDKLGASDGEIGHVKDFYFDDQNWAVRYLVADTGSWMPGRLVLISPHAFGNLYQGGKVLLVNLTRQQIENSPSIESHKPVSRQYEEEYHRYYGWPFYWRGRCIVGHERVSDCHGAVGAIPRRAIDCKARMRKNPTILICGARKRSLAIRFKQPTK